MSIFQSFAPNNAFNTPRGRTVYPNPFADYASTTMPTTMKEIFALCENVYYGNSVVREAARRVLAFFITELSFRAVESREPLGDDESSKYKNFAAKTLRANTFAQEAGLDFMAYGNMLLSVIPGVTRYVYCPKCVEEGRYFGVPIREFIDEPKYDFKWQPPRVEGRCPVDNCGHSGEWKVSDIRSKDPAKVFIRRWPPREIEIRSFPNSARKEYIWIIPGDYRAHAKRGIPLLLETEPWEFIEAACLDRDFQFAEGAIYHDYEPTLAGVWAAGWGIPRTLVNYRHVWYWQLMHRTNEAIGADYILPIRVITPAPENDNSDVEGGDPLLPISGAGLRMAIDHAIKNRHVDPGQWTFLPRPVAYHLLGGDAKQLVTPDLLEQATAILLNGMGFPVEMFKGTMSLQAALPGIRLFQASWTPLVQVLNAAITWVFSKVCAITDWEPVEAEFVSPVLVDDIQKTMAGLQLMAQGKVSEPTALASMGLDAREEAKRQGDFELFKARQQMELQERIEKDQAAKQFAQQQPPPQQQQGGDPNAQGGQGGAPGAAGAAGSQGPQGGQTGSLAAALAPNAVKPQSVDELYAMAGGVAQDMATLQPGQRESALVQLKKKSPELHAAVKQQLDTIDSQMRTAGKQMIVDQQSQQQGQPTQQ